MTINKIITAITAIIFLYFAFHLEVGIKKEYVKVLYKNNITLHFCKDEAERKDLKLKSDYRILFFDGEYFFEEFPGKYGASNNKCVIVEDGTMLQEGNVSLFEYLFLLALIVFIGYCACVIFGEDF